MGFGRLCKQEKILSFKDIFIIFFFDFAPVFSIFLVEVKKFKLKDKFGDFFSQKITIPKLKGHIKRIIITRYDINKNTT